MEQVCTDKMQSLRAAKTISFIEDNTEVLEYYTTANELYIIPSIQYNDVIERFWINVDKCVDFKAMSCKACNLHVKYMLFPNASEMCRSDIDLVSGEGCEGKASGSATSGLYILVFVMLAVFTIIFVVAAVFFMKLKRRTQYIANAAANVAPISAIANEYV